MLSFFEKIKRAFFVKETEFDIPRLYFGHVVCIKEKIPVYHDDSFFDNTIRRPRCIIDTLIDGRKAIIINSELFFEEEWFLNAMIQHCVCHILYHMHNDDTYQEIFDYEADMYAQQTTDMLQALYRLRKYGYDVDKRISRLELEEIERYR